MVTGTVMVSSNPVTGTAPVILLRAPVKSMISRFPAAVSMFLRCSPLRSTSAMKTACTPLSRIVPAIRRLAARCSWLVMVTNDLFSDGEEYSSSVQEYLRCLAEINRQAAEMADCAVEVVYSVPVALKGELPCV